MPDQTWNARLVAIMTTLGTVYRTEITTPLIEAWRLVLSDMTAEEIERAAILHMRSKSAFFPSPGELLVHTTATASDEARVWWQLVLKACSAVGSYRNVSFENPAVHYAIQAIGGWAAICHIPENELPFRERDFIDHYRIGKQLGIQYGGMAPRYFLGILDSENITNGHRLGEVTVCLPTGRTAELPANHFGPPQIAAPRAQGLLRIGADSLGEAIHQ